MSGILNQRNALYVLVVALALLPLYAQLADSPYLVAEFRRYMIFAIVAISLDLILGYGGMVCFGQAMFFGIGCYGAGVYSLYFAEGEGFLHSLMFDALAVWLLAAITGGTAAFLVGLVSLRSTGVYFIMITLAFAQLAYFVFTGLRVWGGDEGLRFSAPEHLLGIINLDNHMVFYFVTFLVLFGVMLAMHRLIGSRFGLVIQGGMQNSRRMRALGFETFRYQLVCFTIAGAVAGLAGGLFATHESFISPSIMSWNRSGELIVMVLIGGAGTLVGPVYGAILFLILESFLPEYSEHWMLAFGPVLIVIVLVANRGIYGSLAKNSAAPQEIIRETRVA